MKRIISTFLFLMTMATVWSQTMNVNIGDVTYAISAKDAGDMTFTDATSLTIGAKTYTLADITSIVVDDSSVTDNTVNVTYSTSGAKVLIAGNLAPYVSATVNGANVTVLATSDLEELVTYTLSGSSSNGSFYMDGSYKMALVFNELTLTNPDSAAVNIQNGKHIAITLSDGTTNSLVDGGTDDGLSDSHKAPLVINGHSSWTGSGSLTLTGNVKHGYFSDEYTSLESGLGTITVASAVGDGFHVNEYFQMAAGTVNITAAGDGVDVGLKNSSTDELNGMFVFSGGTLNVTTSGNAYKALKSDSTMTITGGTIVAETTGSGEYDESDADVSACAAAKCAIFNMSDGTVSLTSTGNGGKGLNCDGNITISGGSLTVVTTGDIYEYSSTLTTKPQGIKSDASIYLNGGTVFSAAGAYDAGAAPFKADGYIYTNGATMMGIGDKKVTPTALSSCGYNNSNTGVSVTGGGTLTYSGVSFTVPSIYSNSSAKIIVSSSSM